MQTLCVGCSKAETKFFDPPTDHFPRAQDRQNLISWRWSLPTPTDPVWWRSLNAISSYRGNRPSNKHTNRQDWLQYSAPLTLSKKQQRTLINQMCVLNAMVYKVSSSTLNITLFFTSNIYKITWTS